MQTLSRSFFATPVKARAAFALLVAALVFAAAAGVAAMLLGWARGAVSDGLADRQDTLLAQTARAIDRQLLMRQAVLQALSAQLMKAGGDAQQIRVLLQNSPALPTHFDRFSVFDVTENSVVDFPQDAWEDDVIRRTTVLELVKEAAGSGKGRIGLSLAADERGPSWVVLATPVRDVAGKVILVTAGLLDLAKLNLAERLEPFKAGSRGYAYMSTPDGSVLIHTLPSRLLKSAMRRSEDRQVIVPVRNSVAAMGDADPASVELVATQRLQSSGWILTAVSKQPDSLVPFDRAGALLPFFAMLAALAGGALAWWLSPVLISPFEQKAGASLIPLSMTCAPSDEDISDDPLARSRVRAMELCRRQAQLDAINEASPLGVLCFDARGNCNYANQSFERISGFTPDMAAGKGWRRCVHPEDRYALWKELPGRAGAGMEPYARICRLRHKDGRVVWVSVKAVAIVVESSANGYVASVEDITAHRAGELALLKSEQRLRLITDNIPALIAYVTPDERVAFANRRYEEAYGILHEELCGMRTWEVLGPDVYAVSRSYIRQALAGTPAHFERQVRQGSAVRFERVNYIPDIDPQGRVLGYFGMVDDITALKQVEEQLRRLVRYDSLTGIGNRAHFEERLIDAIRHSRRNGMLMAVMFLDIDHFKEINDTFGHQTGDEVLREFAQRLLNCVRETDTVARLAGDEFVIILEGLSNADEAPSVAGKIVSAMDDDFKLAGGIRKVTASIGITVRQDEEEDAMVLLKRADEALYRAKSAGRNTYRMLT